MNKNNGLKNIKYGLLSQIITTILGIIIPRLVLVNLGSEANGLNSSVGNILGYMALLEAGVGTATLNALYSPLGNDDKKSINGIMSATNVFYRRTGTAYLSIVLVLSVAYTFFIKTTLPKTTVFAFVILSGLSGVISYFFQGKFSVFLQACGKGYVLTIISTSISVASNLLKIVLLLSGLGIVSLSAMHFGLNLVQMLAITLYIRKNYSWIDLSVKPDLEAISQHRSVIVHQISWLVFSNTDVLILTLMTDLKVVSVYSMYAMIFGMIKAIVVVFTGSYSYLLGQSYEDRPKFLQLYDAHELFTLAFSTAAFGVGGILMTPFLKLYTSGVTDISYIDRFIPWLFVAYYLLHNARASSSTLIDISQNFDRTRWHAVVEAVVNLISSIILTYYFGIYGVLAGTILALLFRTNAMIIFASKLIDRKSWKTYRRWIRNIILLVVLVFIASSFNLILDNYWKLTCYGLCLSAGAIGLFLGVNYLLDRETCRYLINIVICLIKNRTAGKN